MQELATPFQAFYCRQPAPCCAESLAACPVLLLAQAARALLTGCCLGKLRDIFAVLARRTAPATLTGRAGAGHRSKSSRPMHSG